MNADTSAIRPTVHGHTSGSAISIDYEPFIGITEIEIIVNDFGIGELADTVHFTLTIEENLSNGKEIFPRRFELINAYPNPFNPSITLNLQIDKQRKVSAFIFNINGKRVKTLAEDQIFNLGAHTMKWHSEDDFGRKVSNGIYFIQITSEDIIIKRKIIYMK